MEFLVTNIMRKQSVQRYNTKYNTKLCTQNYAKETRNAEVIVSSITGISDFIFQKIYLERDTCTHATE